MNDIEKRVAALESVVEWIVAWIALVVIIGANIALVAFWRDVERSIQ